MDKLRELLKALWEWIKAWWNVPEEPVEPEPEVPHIPSPFWKNGRKNYFTDAEDLVIDGYHYTGGGVALTFRGHSKNVTIKNSSFTNVSKGILIDRAKGATIDGLTIENCKAFNFSKSLLDCAPKCKNIRIDNCVVDSNYNWSENFVMGVVIREDCEGVYIGNSNFKNFLYYRWNLKDGKYINGDAIAIEWRCKDVVLEDLIIIRASDGGIDTKSGGLYRNITIIDTKRAFRAWDKTVPYKFEGTNEFTDCNSQVVFDWIKAVKGDEAKITKVTGGAGLWARYPEVRFEGLDTIDFENTSSEIKLDK